LEEVLREYLEKVRQCPLLFLDAAHDESASPTRKRIRRRALRQGLLQWHTYKGLAVPDSPTSLGENARILPHPYVRVPEEQILEPAKRKKQLFAETELPLDNPRVHEVLKRCLADLEFPRELQELGMAIYLDRPLGVMKPSAEPDRTPLLSYELVSKSLASIRLRFLGQVPVFGKACSSIPALDEMLQAGPRQRGLPIRADSDRQKPGVVALEDAAKIADDFVLLRTTKESARVFLELLDFTFVARRFDLEVLESTDPLLIVRANVVEDREPSSIVIFDSKQQRRLELAVDASSGFRSRAGIEFPRAGLRVQRVWTRSGTNTELKVVDLRSEDVIVPARTD
jgi:hypothetical protein